jgi:phosphoserine aminotransferase
MLAVEDYLDALKWAEKIGGLPALMGRADANLAALAAWVKRTDWVDFLARDEKTRSNTSVCLKIVDPWFTALAKDAQAAAANKIANILEKEGVALDIAAYRSAPPGLRIWCGATVETVDIERLTPWLDWAFAQVKQS